MHNFYRLNNFTGWALFLFTTLVYSLTVEPTASFWDCGEFIAAAYKLEVPHPPGAPLFLLLGRMFSLLAPDAESVAVWVNGVSVLSSSFTILFLYWSIVLLVRKGGRIKPGEETCLQAGLMIGSGIVGALAYAFSDSFWFSAEEAEVYALSSFFMAIVFWAALKWELIKDKQLENKWLILIAYLVGLSIGAHLLNLLCIPAMALIWYFKKYRQTTYKGAVAAILLGFLLVGAITSGIIPGLPSLAAGFEIYFVNSLGLPFGSGIITFIALILAALAAGVIYSQLKGKALLNTALLCLTFILIGYASYTLVLIRSSYNPPIDQNNPDNILSFIYYLKREQYGDRPLLWGNYFDAEIAGFDKGAPVYRKGPHRYEVAHYKTEYKFADADKTLLPRIYSVQTQHQQLYRQQLGLQPHEKPGFGDNLRFMFNYQLGHMYWRYFLWNFAGRAGDGRDAGWLSPLDAFKGDLPHALESNKARNNFLMLPLLLGLTGAFYQYRQDRKGFALLAMLFIGMGAALVLYLNSPPVEPRERDYIYVGSFYAFAIWIGFGVYALGHALMKVNRLQPQLIPALVVSVCMLVPALMATEGWDDHDRSNRYFSVDSARNMLTSCAPNAILFTGGDNDTYPLWYLQEVEGFRTDVRVVVLPYLNAGWFINQLTQKKNSSAPLPLTLSQENYQEGGLNDIIYHVENKSVKGPLPLDQYLKLVQQNHPAIQLKHQSEVFNTIPGKTIGQTINKEEVLAKGIIPAGKEDMLVDKMVFKIKNNALYKADLFILDLISTNQWERPIYFNNTSLQSIGLDLSNWVVHEGTAYRLLPLQNADPQREMVNTPAMYANLMEKFTFREVNNPDVYLSEEYLRLLQNHRASFNTLAGALLEEGKADEAENVLLRSLEVMPDKSVPYDFSSVYTAALLLELGLEKEAHHITDTLAGRADEMLEYLAKEDIADQQEQQKNLLILNQLARNMAAMGVEQKAKEYEALFSRHYNHAKQLL
ncbi:DUF2723 domain-containing protein [Cesiribacter sp. SM1]|uniref:glycosyltransferase family 117 protein n=1 Tax=Cesiribacter sp. SM1 TaxID=2861196 RepID=UPI001CD55833|nr:DUF2723 domain-containing protein [Cesiribacter sp. SM1]